MESDRLARWRYKDPLSLAEAAPLLCDAEPGLPYRQSGKADIGERHTGARIATMQRDLIAAINAGELAGTLRHRQYTTGGGTNFVTGEPIRPTPHRELDLGTSTIPRANLIAWARARGLDPVVWREPQAPRIADIESADDRHMQPKAETTALSIIAALADLAELDIRQPQSRKPGNVADEVAAKIEGLRLRKVTPRTIGDWLRKARDLPRDS